MRLNLFGIGGIGPSGLCWGREVVRRPVIFTPLSTVREVGESEARRRTGRGGESETGKVLVLTAIAPRPFRLCKPGGGF